MEVINAPTMLRKEIFANDLSCRKAFKMANSPPVTAIRNTTIDSKTKCKEWSPQPKTHRLSIGLITMHTTIPNRAVNMLNSLTLSIQRLI